MWGWCSDSEWWNRHMLNVYYSHPIFSLPTVLEGSGLENDNCEILFPCPRRTCFPKKTKEILAYTFLHWIYSKCGSKVFYALHCFPQFPVPAGDCSQVSLNLWLQIKPYRDHKSAWEADTFLQVRFKAVRCKRVVSWKDICQEGLTGRKLNKNSTLCERRVKFMPWCSSLSSVI